MSLTRLRAALDEAERRACSTRLETPAQIAVAAVLVAEFADTFNVKCDGSAVTAAYQMALGDLPADVIVPATQRVLASWKWGQRVPMPGDVRAEAWDELEQRKADIALLHRAEFHRTRNPVTETTPPPDEAELARRKAVARQARLDAGLPVDDEHAAARADSIDRVTLPEEELPY